MNRTNTIQLIPSKTQRKILKEMMFLSSCIHNQANYLVRKQIINNQKIYSFFDLIKNLQSSDNYQLLGKSYSSPKIQQYSEVVKSYFGLFKIKTNQKINLPKYYKNRKTNTTIPSNLLIDGYQYKIKINDVRIPLSRELRKKYNIKERSFNIKYNGVLKHKGRQLRGEIHFKDGHFYLHQSVELPTPEPQKIINSLGIDLGVKRLITSVTEKGNKLIIGSNRFYKQWCHYNKLIADEKSYLSTINRKSSNKLKRLFSKRKKYQKQLFDNIVCKLFRFSKKHNVQQLFLGDVKGITGDKKMGRNINSMINNYWSYNILTTKILCKAEEQGITVIKTPEYYTSTTCPECNHCSKDNVNDRSFICTSCAYVSDRDVVGARNILFKGMYGLESIHRGEVAPLEVSI